MCVRFAPSQCARSIAITRSRAGLGNATATCFAQQGWNVAATVRKLENESEC
jgi:NADP-dependent 3-hydroxy acid dehydrogenase YdfG